MKPKESEIAAIRERRAKITVPPWSLSENNFIVSDDLGASNGGVVAEIDCYSGRAEDADFIINAPTDIDTLLAEYDSLRTQLRDAIWFIESRGYRRCDIPACNCPFWHGGNVEQRLREISDELGNETNGRTILDAVMLRGAQLEKARREAAIARNDAIDEAVAKVRKMENDNKESYEYWKSVSRDPEHWGVMKFLAYSGEDSRVAAELETLKGSPTREKGNVDG